MSASMALSCPLYLTSIEHPTLWQRKLPKCAAQPKLRGRMSAARTCWGIYREIAHSPGRVDVDRIILDRVGAALVARGFKVELISPDANFDSDFANIFVMCERGPILDRLKSAEKTGSIVVNSPDAIRNTYRHRMFELFARHGVAAPGSHVVATGASNPPQKGVWIKRYDFHATEAQDVMYTVSEE